MICTWFIRYCLAYCYLHIIEEEVAEFVMEWNSHYIHPVHGSRCPAGVPDDLFELPELTGVYPVCYHVLCMKIDMFLTLQEHVITCAKTLMGECGQLPIIHYQRILLLFSH